MKKLLSLLSVLTISGTAVPTTIAASSYQKEKTIKNNDINNYINYLQKNNLEKLNIKKRSLVNDLWKIIATSEHKFFGPVESWNNKIFWTSEDGKLYEYEKDTKKLNIISINYYTITTRAVLFNNKIYFGAKRTIKHPTNGFITKSYKIYEYNINDKSGNFLNSSDYTISGEIKNICTLNNRLYFSQDDNFKKYSEYDFYHNFSIALNDTYNLNIINNIKNIFDGYNSISRVISGDKYYLILNDKEIYEYENIDLGEDLIQTWNNDFNSWKVLINQELKETLSNLKDDSAKENAKRIWKLRELREINTKILILNGYIATIETRNQIITLRQKIQNLDISFNSLKLKLNELKLKVENLISNSDLTNCANFASLAGGGASLISSLPLDIFKKISSIPVIGNISSAVLTISSAVCSIINS